MLTEIQNKITALKKETNTTILAHSYQSMDIIDVADHVGDSYQLSVAAGRDSAPNILMCGVRFMAETAKMLNPGKRVYLANANAGCPMADQFTGKDIAKIKETAPDRTVVCYINTTADIKAQSDVCVTSSTAVKIVSRIENDKILFIPDKNLGSFVARHLPEKDIMLIDGCCPYHDAIDADIVMAMKDLHPEARLLVHPECRPEVVALADYVGATSGIVGEFELCPEREYIIGTEISIAQNLQYKYPRTPIYPLSKKLMCPEMRLTALIDLYRTLLAVKEGEGEAEEIIMDMAEIEGARRCIDEMLRLTDN